MKIPKNSPAAAGLFDTCIVGVSVLKLAVFRFLHISFLLDGRIFADNGRIIGEIGRIIRNPAVQLIIRPN
ncbi:hypothetical protein BTO28_11450 [Domibacillus epiphyticus]|uniref:Uncharacterized protein n=1 Tax=Domibacillus epiphyticus TaxID=1714355 RepID=A0A1V2A6M2_9BACI|nr:hypothetical protein BTO28_11450 [Domibacillus epiphyticus]